MRWWILSLLILLSLAFAQTPAQRSPENAVALWNPFAIGYETRIDTNLFGSVAVLGSELAGKLRYPLEAWGAFEPYAFGTLYYHWYNPTSQNRITAVAGMGLEVPLAFWLVTSEERPMGIYTALEIGVGLPIGNGSDSSSARYGLNIGTTWSYRFNW